MKKNQPTAWFVLGCSGAAFSLLGAAGGGRVSLLAIAVVAAVILVLFFWISRRRRPDADADSLTGLSPAPDALPCLDAAGMTQIEGLPESGPVPTAKSSPGLHGKIEVLVNDQSLCTYLITDNPLPIGRDPAQALVVIQEPIVSKLHCQVFARGGQVFIKDLKSTNGVYVNDKKVEECELKDSDVVFLGKKGTVRIAYHR